MMAILLLGIALRVAWVGRPLDHRIRAPWRQADYTQIARNFAREDPNLLHPRIDWRRDGPGLVEMEFPLVPWTAGMLDRLFGYREQYLRLLGTLLDLLAQVAHVDVDAARVAIGAVAPDRAQPCADAPAGGVAKEPVEGC